MHIPSRQSDFETLRFARKLKVPRGTGEVITESAADTASQASHERCDPSRTTGELAGVTEQRWEPHFSLVIGLNSNTMIIISEHASFNVYGSPITTGRALAPSSAMRDTLLVISLLERSMPALVRSHQHQYSPGTFLVSECIRSCSSDRVIQLPHAACRSCTAAAAWTWQYVRNTTTPSVRCSISDFPTLL